MADVAPAPAQPQENGAEADGAKQDNQDQVEVENEPPTLVGAPVQVEVQSWAKENAADSRRPQNPREFAELYSSE